MVLSRQTDLFRQDEKAQGKLFSPQDREKMIRPYLPSPKKPSAQPKRTQPLRDFLKTQIDLLVFTLMHLFFSAYIRIRQTQHAVADRIFSILYYHHRAPELIKQDVKRLDRLPRHLSVILELKGEEHGIAGLEQLMDDVAELSAWCCCAGIPTLSVYEKTGSWLVHRIAYPWLRLIRHRHPQNLCTSDTASHQQEAACIFWTACPVIELGSSPPFIV